MMVRGKEGYVWDWVVLTQGLTHYEVLRIL